MRHMMTFQSFQDLCRGYAQLSPACAGWEFSFKEQDFQREWHVNAWDGHNSGMDHVSAPRVTPGDIPRFLGNLARLIHELRTSEAEAHHVTNKVQAEIEAGLRATRG